jgi:uncharacterized protein
LRLLVSLHDVTPAHRARLDRAEALLADAGVDRVAYLLVPDFHRRNPLAGDRTFRDWCRRDRPFTIDWVLHGYHHVEDPPDVRSGPRAWFARCVMTGGEGEFLALESRVQDERLVLGRELVAETVGVMPRAFVAPAWLFNETLVPALARLGFAYTEDHSRVIDVQHGVTRRSPVLCWATRTTVRRIGSRVVCPILNTLIRHEPVIRLAIHPFDMDYAPTADQIRRVLGACLERRESAGYEELFAPPV